MYPQQWAGIICTARQIEFRFVDAVAASELDARDSRCSPHVALLAVRWHDQAGADLRSKVLWSAWSRHGERERDREREREREIERERERERI